MSVLLWIGIFGAVLWGFILLFDRLYDFEAHGISLSPGILMWRTKRGLGVLDRVSGAWRKGWKVFGTLGAGIGAIFMLIMFALFILNTIVLFTVGAPPGAGGAGVKVAVPGVTIPLVLGIIGLATVLLVHEPAHGIVLRRLNLRTKSTGLALFLVIPGAFVEEDEDEFKKASVWERLQVAGAGSFANLLFGVLCFLIVLALVAPLPGLYVNNTIENTPATEAGFQAESRIIRVDNVGIDGYRDFDSFMDDTQPGENITLYTEERQYSITLGERENHPEENKGYIGIENFAWSVSKRRFIRPSWIFTAATFEILGRPIINQYVYDAPVPWRLIEILKWMFTLNLLVGLFNLLPLKPLDGGHIVECLAEKITSKPTAGAVAKGLSVITLGIILLNFIPGFV